jgi:hypothetical protein
MLLLQGLGDQGFGVLDEYGALSGVGEVGEGACAAATLSTGDECRGRPLASTSGGELPGPRVVVVVVEVVVVLHAPLGRRQLGSSPGRHGFGCGWPGHLCPGHRS